MNRRVVLILILFGGLVLTALAPHCPEFRGLPYRDSGVFMYSGWRILEGEVPYRDFWDHKTPLIFFLNALALGLSGGSLWGVWFLEVFALTAALGLGFVVMRDAFGPSPSALASVLWLTSFMLIADGGNLTEEYALPLNFALLLLYRRSESEGDGKAGGQSFGISLLIGAATGLLFLLKPNLIGTAFAVVLCLFATRFIEGRWRDLAAGIGAYTMGLAAVLGACAGYFVANGALRDALDAAIVFNLRYSAGGEGMRLFTLVRGIRRLSDSGIIFIAAGGWVAAVIRALFPVTRSVLAEPLLRVLLVALPVEMALASLSGRDYPHYYLPWLPPLAGLSAFVFKMVTDRIAIPGNAAGQAAPAPETMRAASPRRRLIFAAGLGMMIALSVARPSRHWEGQFDRIEKYLEAKPMESELVRYILENTDEDDTVLFWGSEAAMNFLTRRRAPTRFVYQHTLFEADYPNPEDLSAFAKELTSNPPLLIIDTSNTHPRIPPINRRLHADWIAEGGHASDPHPREVGEVRAFIRANYKSVGWKKDYYWEVYRYDPPDRMVAGNP